MNDAGPPIHDRGERRNKPENNRRKPGRPQLEPVRLAALEEPRALRRAGLDVVAIGRKAILVIGHIGQ